MQKAIVLLEVICHLLMMHTRKRYVVFSILIDTTIFHQQLDSDAHFTQHILNH